MILKLSLYGINRTGLLTDLKMGTYQAIGLLLAESRIGVMLFSVLVGKQNGNLNLCWSSLQITTEGSK